MTSSRIRVVDDAPMQVPSGWWAVADAWRLKRRPLGLTLAGRNLVLWRDREGVARAAADRCPHRGVSLALGTVEDGCVACPFHGFRFDAAGDCVAVPCDPELPLPAKGLGLRTYPVREAHELLWVWLGPPEEAAHTAVPWFPVLEPLGQAGFEVTWRAHWERVVENQLDFIHLPFVHRRTIGNGLPGAMTVETDTSDGIRAWAPSQGPTGVHLKWPNIWILDLAPTVKQFLAYVPVSERETRIVVRMYAGSRASWLWRLVRPLAAQANRFILAEDQAVVESHTPAAWSPGDRERLVAQDAPVAAFRAGLRARTRRAGDDPDTTGAPEPGAPPAPAPAR